MGSKAKELEKCNFHDFDVDSGHWMVDGKSYWPDHVVVRMTRSKALRFAMMLQRAAVGEGYAPQNIDWSEIVDVNFAGKLSRSGE